MLHGYIIGVDIGGTNIRVGAKKDEDELLFLQKVQCSKVFDGKDPIKKLALFLQGYIKEALGGAQVSAIAIGFPSTLSKDRKIVLQTPNIKGMDNLAFADGLYSMLGIPVFLEKDVNMLLLSDMLRYRLPAEGIVIGIYVGTGIGNAIVVNGTLLAGKDGVAGELGHIPMIGGTEICGCGNIGCSECYASGRLLAETAEKHFADTAMEELFIRHGNSPVLREFVDNIACVAATEINILNPDYIIMGGGVVNMAGFPKGYFEERLYGHTRKPYPAKGLNIIYSTNAAENGVNGAIYYARQSLKKLQA